MLRTTGRFIVKSTIIAVLLILAAPTLVDAGVNKNPVKTRPRVKVPRIGAGPAQEQLRLLLRRTPRQSRYAPHGLDFVGKINKLNESFLKTLTDPLLLKARVYESGAMKRRGVQLRGGTKIPITKGLDFEGDNVFLRVAHEANPKKVALRFEGRDYVELTNATALTTRDPGGGKREFLLARAVMPYETRVDLQTGRIGTKDYYGDVVLFERKVTRHGGKKKTSWVPRRTLLKSDPARGVIIEDPRIFVRYLNGRQRTFLGFTELAAHLKGSDELDVMNRYVELTMDKKGSPLPPELDRVSGRPVGFDLGPPPAARRGKTPQLNVIAKNGMFSENELGQIVMRGRFFLDFNHPVVKKLAGKLRWKYAEQVFVFKSFKEFQQYDWRYGLDDLFASGAASDRGPKGRVRPLQSKVLLTDQQLRENFDRSQVIDKEGKGFGPGTMPVRLRRSGDKVYVSEARGAPEILVGKIKPLLRDRFALADGEVKFITFDHEMRSFSERGFHKRHYSGSVKLFDHTLTSIDAYYADAIQPKRWYERGKNSSIVDLQHLYPVGRTIRNERGRGVTISVYAGTSDAHTAQYDFKLMKLLEELSSGSSRWNSGQIYRPGDPR